MRDGCLKRIIKLFFVLISIFGCTAKQPEVIESKEPFTIQLFYSQTCPKCKSLKENFIPALQKDFGEQMTFIEHDIDMQESIDLFYSYTGLYDWEIQEWKIDSQFEGIPIDLLCNEDKSKCDITWIPLVIVGDMYAFLGYDNQYLEDYISDVHLALQDKELTNSAYKDWRFLLKNEKDY